MPSMVQGYPTRVTLSTGPLGGLGDHAIFSTLVERFHDEGHKVYLHRDNICRNDEQWDVFWGRNPYIEGESSETPHIGYEPFHGAFWTLCNELGGNRAIEAMERVHGLPPPYRMAPKLYYRPSRYKHDLSSFVLMDLAALSSTIIEDGWKQFHAKMIERFGINRIVILRFPIWVNPNQPDLPPGVPALEVDSLYAYIDMLGAAKGWIGSEAGGQSLAAAVRGEHDVYEDGIKPEVVCLSTPATYNSGGYRFRGVDYRISKFSAGTDYLAPVEVPYYHYSKMTRENTLAKREAWRLAKANAELQGELI